jgi:hypothetical protein
MFDHVFAIPTSQLAEQRDQVGAELAERGEGSR